LDIPAGIYDTVHAKLAVDKKTGRAHVKITAKADFSLAGPTVFNG
jgi:hypothetical protein